MKKFFTSLFAVILIIGIAALGTTFSDAMVFLNGKTVDLNSSSASDFDKKAYIEGEVYYVYDCIAVEEVTHTTYGIKTGTDETNFYLIESYNKDWYTDLDDTYEPLTLVYATANKDKIAKLDKMVEAWYDYEDKAYSAETQEEFDAIELPSETFEISGMISKYDDKKLYQYRDDYIGEIRESYGDSEQFIKDNCVDMIIKDANPKATKTLFFVAIALTLVGLIGLIATLVASKNKNKDELY